MCKAVRAVRAAGRLEAAVGGGAMSKAHGFWHDAGRPAARTPGDGRDTRRSETELTDRDPIRLCGGNCGVWVLCHGPREKSRQRVTGVATGVCWSWVLGAERSAVSFPRARSRRKFMFADATANYPTGLVLAMTGRWHCSSHEP